MQCRTFVCFLPQTLIGCFAADPCGERSADQQSDKYDKLSCSALQALDQGEWIHFSNPDYFEEKKDYMQTKREQDKLFQAPTEQWSKKTWDTPESSFRAQKMKSFRQTWTGKTNENLFLELLSEPKNFAQGKQEQKSCHDFFTMILAHHLNSRTWLRDFSQMGGPRYFIVSCQSQSQLAFWVWG